MQYHTLLLVSEDEVLRQILAEQLSHHNEFRVSVFANLAQVGAKLEKADALILDLKNANPDDCTNTSADFSGVRLFITSTADTEEEIEKDTIARPVRFGILLSKLRALLRKQTSTPKDAPDWQIGEHRFYGTAKTLARGDEKIKLTEKEADILQYLHRARAQVSRDVLLGEVWGYQAGVSTHTLETHIYRLRRKIGASFLITEEGGYRLCSEAETKGDKK